MSLNFERLIREPITGEGNGFPSMSTMVKLRTPEIITVFGETKMSLIQEAENQGGIFISY